jgi:hypothetical protein
MAPNGALAIKFAGLLLAEAELLEATFDDFTILVLVVVFAARLLFFALLVLAFLVAMKKYSPL